MITAPTTPETPAPGFLTTSELHARFPWFAPNYWARLRCRGGGPAFYRIGNRIVYRETEVIAWIEGFRATSTAETKRQRRAA